MQTKYIYKNANEIITKRKNAINNKDKKTKLIKEHTKAMLNETKFIIEYTKLMKNKNKITEGYGIILY